MLTGRFRAAPGRCEAIYNGAMLGTVSSAALGAVFIALFGGCGGASPAATQTPMPMPMLTCTTQATPDLDVASDFDVDTGFVAVDRRRRLRPSGL